MVDLQNTAPHKLWTDIMPVCENLNRWSLWIYLLCRNNSTTFLSTHVSRAQISVEVPSELPSELFRLVTGNFLQDENQFLGNMSEIS